MRHIVTKKPINYAGRRYHPGDAVDLSRKDGRLFRALGFAIDAPILDDNGAPNVLDPVAVQIDQSESAADAAASIEHPPVDPIIENRSLVAEPVEISERTGKAKRPYKRRDLSAE
jgi:hypothetical protein